MDNGTTRPEATKTLLRISTGRPLQLFEPCENNFDSGQRGFGRFTR